MFCKRCGNKLTDGDEICSNCGAQINPDDYNRSRFAVKLPETETEIDSTGETEDTEEAVSENKDVAAEIEEATTDKDEAEAAEGEEKTAEEQEKAEENIEPKPEEISEEAEDIPQKVEEVSEKTETVSEKDGEVPQKNEAAVKTAPAEKTDKPKKPVVIPLDNSKEIKKAKRSYIAIKAIACLCAVIIAALTGVSIFTDVFESSSDSVKTVALSGLTDSEKESFEEFFSKLYPLYGKKINFRKEGIYDFLDLIDASSQNGLYASFFGKAEHVTDTADPANRFGSADGSWNYYKVKASQLKKLAERFGIELVNSANNLRYYFLDGYYYFADEKAASNSKKTTDIEVSNSKRTEDGNYYVTCSLDGSKDKAIYCLVSYDREQQGDAAWVLREISDEEMFSIDGTRIAAADENSLAFEMRHEVITAKTKKNKIYAKYIVDYPYFTDEQSTTAQTINALYSEIVASYKETAKKADRSYRKYNRKGYDKSLLPAYTYFVSTVEYNKNGYISLLDETTYYSPETVAKEMKKAAENGTEYEKPFPTLTYSGYTIKTETGEFLKREDVFGSDYSTYQSKLYELYMGYGEDYEGTVPPDNDNIGPLIYSCPWVLTENGVGFCYQGENGYNNFIVLPYSNIENSTF